RFWRFFLKLSVVAFALGVFGLAYLDAQVRNKFEGKKWAIPAKVYARPLELYSGLALTRDELVHELKGLGYRAVRRASSPGTMEVAANRVRMYTRGFHFPDGVEKSQSVLVSFNGNQVASVKNIVNKSLPLMRLEPVLIGGIYPKDNEDRELIRLENTPAYLADALVVVEDRRFYSHYGVSLKGIARAMVANVKAGRVTQGGSTLTQQLVKNFYLTSERSMARKLMELPMAVLLELHYSKEQILEAYLNEVYLGQSGARAVHGFGLASQYYFAQPLSELRLHQVALLVGMVKGPSFYDPRRRPERAKERRDLVLKLLADNGNITEKQKVAAQNMPLGVVKKARLQNGAYPAFLDLVKRQLKREYPADLLSEEGLKVYTSLDPIVQYRAEKAVTQTLSNLSKRYGSKAQNLQAGMVVTDPQTAEVLAVVGSAQTRFQGFNRALDAKRPIGS
ncbi:MAG: transglycosylase domain-containing protein, partial [Pontibacterium sp.]